MAAITSAHHPLSAALDARREDVGDPREHAEQPRLLEALRTSDGWPGGMRAEWGATRAQRRRGRAACAPSSTRSSPTFIWGENFREDVIPRDWARVTRASRTSEPHETCALRVLPQPAVASGLLRDRIRRLAAFPTTRMKTCQNLPAPAFGKNCATAPSHRAGQTLGAFRRDTCILARQECRPSCSCTAWVAMRRHIFVISRHMAGTSTLGRSICWDTDGRTSRTIRTRSHTMSTTYCASWTRADGTRSISAGSPLVAGSRRGLQQAIQTG